MSALRKTFEEVWESSSASSSDSSWDDGRDSERFSQLGQAWEGVKSPHHYHGNERRIMAKTETIPYMPSSSIAYRKWLRHHISDTEWPVWFLMAVIGIAVGILGFFLHQFIVLIGLKLDWVNQALDPNANDQMALWSTWAWHVSSSAAMVFVASAVVVCYRPSATSSGLPEVIGFLNGAKIKEIFSIKTMFVKFFSCVLAVGAGMPIGPEGPMIHIGALCGGGISQFDPGPFGFSCPLLQRFRNNADKRDFISAGAAAGIAAAFGAPIGGVLFVFEEVSSFFTVKLSWRIFFCSMLSAFTCYILNSAFNGFKFTGHFGEVTKENSILFMVESPVPINVTLILPCVLMGLSCGVLGSLFIYLNLKMTRLRNRVLKLVRGRKKKALKILEPVLIVIIMQTLAILLPSLSGCTYLKDVGLQEGKCLIDKEESLALCLHPNKTTPSLTIGSTVHFYSCPHSIVKVEDQTEDKYHSRYFGSLRYFGHHHHPDTFLIGGSYNEMASLSLTMNHEAILTLFSRNTHLMLNFQALAMYFGMYFILACWAAGTYISSGLVIPILLIGALYGRFIGRIMVEMVGIHEDGSEWDWIDPGAFAMLGAVSFFAGVTRLSLALAVIMLEMTNDIQFLVPFMLSISSAKLLGDYLTHSLYHGLLEIKCIPYLPQEPHVVVNGCQIKLDLYDVKHVMARDVFCLTPVSSAKRISTLLLSKRHGGFPVVIGRGSSAVKVRESDRLITGKFIGTVSRADLTAIMIQFVRQLDSHKLITVVSYKFVPQIPYKDIVARMTKKRQVDTLRTKMVNFMHNPEYDDVAIDLTNYINTSATGIKMDYSLLRAYNLFCGLGLRHIVVVDVDNVVVGMITRRDLMEFNMEEKLKRVIDRRRRQERDDDNKPVTK